MCNNLKNKTVYRSAKHWIYFKTTVNVASKMHPRLYVKLCIVIGNPTAANSQGIYITWIVDLQNMTFVVRESCNIKCIVSHFLFHCQKLFSTMLVSNLYIRHHGLLTFAVVKNYVQLVCFCNKKIQANLGVKGQHIRARVKIYTSFLLEICHIARNLCMCKCCNARGLYCM